MRDMGSRVVGMMIRKEEVNFVPSRNPRMLFVFRMPASIPNFRMPLIPKLRADGTSPDMNSGSTPKPVGIVISSPLPLKCTLHQSCTLPLFLPKLLISRHPITTPNHSLLLLLLHRRRLLRLHNPLLLTPQLSQIPKPQMRQRIYCTNPHLRPQLQHPTQQIQTHLVNLRENHSQVLGGIDMEVRLVLWELTDAWPRAFGGRAHESEDLL